MDTLAHFHGKPRVWHKSGRHAQTKYSPNRAETKWIDMEVKPRFLRNSRLKPREVYLRQ
jgi:hypothetical protein